MPLSMLGGVETIRTGENAEVEIKRTDGCATKMWNHMKKEFGDDWRDWPVVGCGKGFSPWKNGPSMVLVMEVEDDTHLSIIAERPPMSVDQAFKNTRAMAAKDVLENLDLVRLYNMLSNSYPMDKEFMDTDSFTDKYILGVNMYPIDDWKKSDREYMSVMSWIRVAYLIAAGHDGVIMKELREIAFAIEDVNPKIMEINVSMSKERLLKMAREKARLGARIPATLEDIDQLTKHVSRIAVE